MASEQVAHEIQNSVLHAIAIIATNAGISKREIVTAIRLLPSRWDKVRAGLLASGQVHTKGRGPEIRWYPTAVLYRVPDAELEAESLRSTGSRLRWIRSQSGRTMGDLARFLGVSVVEISRLELDRYGGPPHEIPERLL